MLGALKRLLLRAAPPPEYLLNHVVNRVPLIDLRMRLYRLAGVTFEDPSRTTIMHGTEVWDPRRLEMGAHSIVGRDCLLDCRGGLRIGRNVNISSYTRLQTAKHEIDDPDFVASYAPIVVGDRAWIATGAMVVGGVSVGEGAVVVGGSVVTRDVEPYTVVGGVPARKLRDRPRDLRYTLSWRVNWL